MSDPSHTTPEMNGAASPGLSLFGQTGPADGPSICSRKGCRVEASWLLRWNNPRIHAPDRRKVWSSCQDHVVWFEQYLGDRGLWKETVPVHTRPDGRSSEEG